jgi:tRNA(adenine34) deaminase
MQQALKLARIAYDLGEVPVGAIVVNHDIVIGRGFNKRELHQNSLCHAELMAIDEACNNLGCWRLLDATVYVTLEPCLMCAGALLHSRISRLVYGASDPKFGAIESLYQINKDKRLNHRFEAQGGIKALESQELLQDFFAILRKSKA